MDKREIFKQLIGNYYQTLKTYNCFEDLEKEASEHNLRNLLGNFVEVLSKDFIQNLMGFKLINDFGEEVDALSKTQAGEITDIIAVNHTRKILLVISGKFTNKKLGTSSTDIFAVMSSGQTLKERFPNYEVYASVITDVGVSKNFFDQMERRATTTIKPRNIIIVERQKVIDNTTHKPLNFEPVEVMFKLMKEYKDNQEEGTVELLTPPLIDLWGNQQDFHNQYYKQKNKTGRYAGGLFHVARSGKTETCISIIGKESGLYNV